MTTTDTRTALLDAAEEFAQKQGFNAFSYRHLAERLGIKTATIHYYFPSKADLGRELMARYRQHFREAVTEIERSAGSSRERLYRYMDLFSEKFREGGRLCLCGSFASDFLTLPEEVQKEVKAYIKENESWLRQLLMQGAAEGEFRVKDFGLAARAIFSALEGALLSARTFSSSARIESAKKWLIGSLTKEE